MLGVFLGKIYENFRRFFCWESSKEKSTNGKSTKIFKILCYPDTDSLLSGHRFFAIRTPILCYPDTGSYPDRLSKIYENLSCRCPDSKESTKNFVDFGESVRTAVGVRRAKNLRKFRRFVFWLTDNSLGQ